MIGTGATCRVYELPDGNVVKVLLKADFSEAERELLLSKWVFLKGLPTAISYDVAEVDGRPGLLYESLGRDNLRNHFRDSAGALKPLLDEYLALLKAINAIDTEEGQLPSAKQKALAEVREIRDAFTHEEYDGILRLFDTIPENTHMVHGDCHLKNIKVRDGKLFLIDLDTLSAGAPIFELSGLSCAYYAYDALKTGDGGLNEFFGIDDSIIKKTYHYVTDHYYGGLSEEERKENLSRIELLTCIHMLHELKPEDPGDRELYDFMYRRVREGLAEVRDLRLRSGRFPSGKGAMID